MKQKIKLFTLAFGLLVGLLTARARAETYRVGPTRQQKEPTTAFLATLKPGDVVELDGDHTYGPFALTASGTLQAPITLRGVRVNGKRPLIQSSGGFTVHVQRAEHNLLEGLEMSGGDICLRHYGAYTRLRDSLIHHCKNGVLGTDYDSGSLTIEHVEIHSCGSGDQHHQIYMTTDAVAYPGSVFRLQHSYIHDGAGGNNVKTRSERNEIYSNRIEGAYYHELELIGPDRDVFDPYGDVLPREDSDVVGNVIWSRSNTAWSTIRVGGDGTGGTSGRYRFVNNTILAPGSMGGSFFRHFMKLESIEMHNNAIVVLGAGTVRAALQQGFDASWNERSEDAYVWATGQKVIAGTNNWVSASVVDLPSSWTGTRVGSDAGFADLANGDLRPLATSPLVDAGVQQTASAPGFAFPNGLPLPTHEPPATSLTTSATPRVQSNAIDIGAYEAVRASSTPPADAGVLTPAPDAGAPAQQPDAGTPVAQEPDSGAGSAEEPESDSGAPPSGEEGDPSASPPTASPKLATLDAGATAHETPPTEPPSSDAGVTSRLSSQSPSATLEGGCSVAASSKQASLWPLALLLLLALLRSAKGARSN